MAIRTMATELAKPRRRRRGRWIALTLIVLIGMAVIRSRDAEPVIEPGSYLVVPIEGSYTEAQPKDPVTRLFDERNVLVDLLETLRKALHDDRISGVVARIGPLDSGWAQAREIRDARASVRASGKKVIAFLSSDVITGNREYYLGSIADELIVPPAASSMLNGLSAQYFFLGAFWEKLHVAMEVEQIREFKTFGDMLTRRSMSPAHREMANSILDNINDEFLATIADARGLSVEETQEIVNSCPSSAEDFLEAGLADRVLFFDQIESHIDETGQVDLVEASTYAAVSAQSLGLGGGPRVAVIHAAGTIVPGEGGRGATGNSVGSAPLVAALEEAAEDDSIRAIVMRIDSPGGSASASDVVWRAIRKAGEKKPVIASLGDVAASGGYYMAAGSDHIVAEPATLTGSIGVVLFKPNLAGLLGWMGIGTDGLSRGRYARIMDTSKGLDRAESALLRTQMNGVYKRFLDRVAVGRGMTTEEVDAIGGGRVWTGLQALERGLVDALGGLEQAVRAAAVEARVERPESVELVYLPEPQGLLEQLTNLQSGAFAAEPPQPLMDAIDALAPVAGLRAGIHTFSDALPSIR